MNLWKTLLIQTIILPNVARRMCVLIFSKKTLMPYEKHTHELRMPFTGSSLWEGVI